MSILALLFSWTKLPQWAIELVVIMALCIGFAIYHHHVFATGIAAQQAADRAVSARIETQAAIATQAAQDAANRAEESYREEIARSAAAAAARPLGPVRLCIDAHVGSPGLPEAGAAHSGNAGASTPAWIVPAMPDSNPGLRPEWAGPELDGLLGAWAAKADQVSATLREFQSRGHP